MTSYCLYSFLGLCEQYKLVPAEARIAQSMDAQTKRQMKIQRFQKEKLSRARLKEIEAVHISDREDEAENEADGDDDAEREAWLLRIELAVLKAAEQSSQIKQVSPQQCFYTGDGSPPDMRSTRCCLWKCASLDDLTEMSSAASSFRAGSK